MAFDISGVDITLEAGADLSAKQYFLVAIASDGQIDPAGDGANVDGVLQNDPDDAGKAATVRISGVSKVVCGAAITKGDKVASDAAGKAVTAASSDRVIGRALQTTTADGQILAVLLKVAGEPNA
jgi:hypothetical protein